MKKCLKNEKGFVISSMIVILGVLLAVSIGSYVYYSASKTVYDTNNALSEQETSVYNMALVPYLGSSTRGANVRSLIDAVIASNTSNAGQSGKFISIDASKLDSSIGVIGDAGTSLNTTEYVNEYNTKMSSLKTKIEAGKTYNVTASYDVGSGRIKEVIIEEN